MAEQSTHSMVESSYSNGLDRLVEEITCPVCHEFFHEPKLLPCLHFYCRKCLEGLTTNSQPSTPLSCPECRVETVLNREDVHKLPTAFFVNRLKTVYSAMTKAQGAAGVICELCNSSESPVRAFCRHCAQFICEYCEQAHQRLRPFGSHVVISTDELSQNTRRHIPISNTERSVCEEHDQEMRLLCLDCDQLICRDCTVIDHKDHSYDFIKKLAPEVRQTFTDKLTLLQDDQETIKATSEKIMQAKIDITTKAKSVTDFVNHSIDDIISLYEKCRRELLEKIETESRKKLVQLSTEEKHLSILKTEIRNLSDFVEKTLENGTDEDVVSIHKQVLSRAEQEHSKFQESQCHPREGIDMLSIEKDTCVAEITRVASRCISADPEKCALEIQTAKVGKESRMTLHTKTTNNHRCHAKQLLNIDIKSITNRTSCKTTMTEISPGFFEVSFTPRTRGWYTVTVLVNNRPIAGSPFNLHVKPSISQMQTPIRTIQNVHKLADITVTDDRQLLATQTYRGCVISLDREGRLIEVVASGLNCPIGIAASKTGDIYITEGHCLRKFDKALNCIGSIGSLGGTLGNFKNPGRLDVNQRGEVIVCDQINSRVQIFDSNLQFKRWYGTGKPLGVACGKADEIFVTEGRKKRVCKIHDQTFGLREFCKNLNTPRGVYVDDDHVYITEGGQIEVYGHNGQYKGSLGNGVLMNPGGITGDVDGFLYVCDEGAKAIFVF